MAPKLAIRVFGTLSAKNPAAKGFLSWMVSSAYRAQYVMLNSVELDMEDDNDFETDRDGWDSDEVKSDEEVSKSFKEGDEGIFDTEIMSTDT